MEAVTTVKKAQPLLNSAKRYFMRNKHKVSKRTGYRKTGNRANTSQGFKITLGEPQADVNGDRLSKHVLGSAIAL